MKTNSFSKMLTLLVKFEALAYCPSALKEKSLALSCNKRRFIFKFFFPVIMKFQLTVCQEEFNFRSVVTLKGLIILRVKLLLQNKVYYL